MSAMMIALGIFALMLLMMAVRSTPFGRREASLSSSSISR